MNLLDIIMAIAICSAFITLLYDMVWQAVAKQRGSGFRFWAGLFSLYAASWAAILWAVR